MVRFWALINYTHGSPSDSRLRQVAGFIPVHLVGELVGTPTTAKDLMDWQPCKKPQHLRAKTANGKARTDLGCFFAEVPRSLTNFPGVPFLSPVPARHGSLQKACLLFISFLTCFLTYATFLSMTK